MNGVLVLMLSSGVGSMAAIISSASAQWEQSDLGQTAIFEMQNAPYPDESRKDGFKLSGKTFPRDPHYVDSSVAVFIPKGYRPGKQTDLLVYFHGHYNNIRKAFEQYKLREQVVASGKNVIFVFPEGPKDAGDSGCGKLEKPDGLKRLVGEVLDKLVAEGKVPGKELGHVLLSGHSGAYKVIGLSVKHGGLERNVSDVGLLDSTYAELDSFVDWLVRRKDARLFSIFTDHLSWENVYLMTHLTRKKIGYELLVDEDATDATLEKDRVLFLHTEKLKHDDTVQWLERWLKATRLPKR